MPCSASVNKLYIITKKHNLDLDHTYHLYLIIYIHVAGRRINPQIHPPTINFCFFAFYRRLLALEPLAFKLLTFEHLQMYGMMI